MKISKAVAYRVYNLLRENNISQYKFEKDTLIPHNTLKTILKGRYKSMNLKTAFRLAKGFNITVAEFFDDPIFEREDIEIL